MTPATGLASFRRSSRVPIRRLRDVEIALRARRDLEQLLRAVERLLGVDDVRFRHRQVSTLQIGIERE
jgi:hypothetical protein